MFFCSINLYEEMIERFTGSDMVAYTKGLAATIRKKVKTTKRDNNE